MAVNVNQTAQQQQRTQQAPQQQQQPYVLTQIGLQSRLVTYGSGGDQYEKLYEAIQKQIKVINEEGKSKEKYNVVKLLKQNAGLNYSGIIVTETADNVTSAHVLMIEKTGNYPDALIENVAGARYEIIRTPADALDERYIRQTQQTVADVLHIDINSVVVVDGTLVPNEFDVTSENLVNDLINNTLNATHSEIAIRTEDYKGLNIQNLLSNHRNGKFYVDLYFNQDDAVVFDQTGLPIRQDICISLTYKVNNDGKNKSINQGNDTYEIVKTYGYIDFEFVGPAIVNNMIASTQKFVPNFIITHIDSRLAPTPDILMLGVASVLSINEDMNWMQAFRVVPGKKDQIDYNDIGALNIEGNIEQSPTGYGKKYNTKDKTFSIGELNKLIQTLVRPNILVSIDVPKAGPGTWYTSVFQYIKFRNNRAAYDRVNEAVSYMTNGVYQSNNAQMFTDVSNKIHGGFYKTKDGYRDIRHLSSYLSFANYVADTNQQPMLISQYTNTLYNSSIPTELRAAERKKYIDEMSAKSAVYKQYYDRLTFNAGFLMNVIGALKAVGFSPLPTNMGAVNDMFVRRSTVDFSAGMLGADARLMGQNAVYGAYNQSYYNRTF